MAAPLELILEIVRHVAGMAWKIAWGLVLGFGISALAQVFVRPSQVSERLGERSLGALALATGFGAASSSCSYAAAAMSRTLFQKGAHLVNATAFLFASTNLVIEIGLVLWTLLGWHFVAAELFGGLLLIGFSALLLGRLGSARIVERARKRVQTQAEAEHGHGGGARLSWGALRSPRGWRAVGRAFVTDWRMVGRDIALGVAIAGLLAALVPAAAWQALFLSGGGHGVWGVIENVVVGPLVAVAAFVCSVGNIPLAAVLWQNGISFSGVIAFVFADLITVPMLLVYRRYYGWRAALAFGAALFAVIVAAALATEAVFAALGLLPASPATSGAHATRDYFAWDYTTALNAVFLPIGAVLAWLGTGSSGEDG